MLIFYKVKWFAHCLFKLHNRISITTYDGDMVGCHQCSVVQDKHGITYYIQRTED